MNVLQRSVLIPDITFYLRKVAARADASTELKKQYRAFRGDNMKWLADAMCDSSIMSPSP